MTKNAYFILGMIHIMTSMKNVQFLRYPTPLVHLRPKFFHPLDLGRPTPKERPPLQTITSQLKENIIQG